MKFRTEIEIEKFPFQISHKNRLVFIGSCFADEIGMRFKNSGFHSLVNPFGVIFNPISIAGILNDAVNTSTEIQHHIIEHNSRFYSLKHHGSFASNSKANLEQQIAEQNNLLHNNLKQADFLFITLGTAVTYKHIQENKVVANCHKLPNNLFNNNLLNIAEVVENLGTSVEKLRQINPALKVIFTVSPVRYFNFGMHKNQLSKATLLLAVEALTQRLNNCYYFPAYELVIDDLRDYRFMKEDLIHPNKQAVDYIWGKIEQAFLNENTLSLCKRVQSFNAMNNHRMREESNEFKEKIKSEYEALKQLLPHLATA